MRTVAAGGAALAVAAVATAAIAVSRSSEPVRPDAPPTAPFEEGGAVLDGFRLSRLPDGVVRTGPDSVYTAPVTDRGLRTDGAVPAAGEPSASVVMRRFDRGVGIGLFVTVLRPGPSTDPARTADRLVRWAAAGAAPVREFDVAAGRARLLGHANYGIVLTTPGHVVITIEGNSAFSSTEMEAVARGVRRLPG